MMEVSPEMVALSAVLAAPLLIALIVALVKGYSLLVWKHDKNERLPFIGIVKTEPKEDDDG